MKLTIDVVNILKGDVIRKEYAKNAGVVDGNAVAYEFKARYDRDQWNGATGNLFLLERPVVLPTEEGYYESGNYPVGMGCHAYRLAGGTWYGEGAQELGKAHVEHLMPLRKMGVERDVANTVLDRVQSAYANGDISFGLLSTIREDYNK